ncbi:DUF4386 domain-containing protein [Lutibacter maritimus]|uniref:DUF4386 domain-containing protein n=1 Tax=Lutibacter maritimus TaxID=593133 RepID=A0A1I6SF84_9FLAO|nr:DUF4386 domain-containing protein [Lutibacter maritimus]SFS75480.1 protein of unknown function [Lutibacter maritimus]
MKQIAKISGVAYIMIFLAGFYANFAVLENLIDSDDMQITTVNFINNHLQLGYGLIGFIIMLFFDVLLVRSLFDLTKSISKNISYLASFFRLLHAVFFGVALFKFLEIYQLTRESNSTNIQNSVAELLLDFEKLWTVGLLFFGVHLIVLGYLAIKSTYIPKTLGVLLLLAAIGYIIDGLAKLFMSNYSDYKDVFEVIVIMPSVIGEFSLAVWLLIKGFNKKQFKILTT